MQSRALLRMSTALVTMGGGVAAGQGIMLDSGFRAGVLDTNWIRSNPPFDSQSDGFFGEAPSLFEEWTIGASAQVADASASLTHSSFATTSLFQADVSVAASASANPGAYDLFTSLAISSYQVDFTLDQAVDFLFDGDLFADGGASARIRILDLGSGSNVVDFNASDSVISIDETLTLAAGNYSFRANADSSFFDASADAEGAAGFAFTFRAIPAPGVAVPVAIALCTTRRRR